MKKTTLNWNLAIILLVIISSLLIPGSVVSAQTDSPELTFADLGYGDTRMQSLYGEASIWIPMRSDWVLSETPAEITVRYVASPVLMDGGTTLTVYTGGIPVTSLRPITDGTTHEFTFVVPTSRIVTDEFGFLLRIVGQMKINDQTCQDIDNPGQWINILKESTVRFSPTLDRATPQLSDLPYSIVVQNAIDGNPPPVIFVLPNDYHPTEMTTAAQVAARLSRESASAGQPATSYQVATNDSLTPEQRSEANLVIVGSLDRQPLLSEISNSLRSGLSGDNFLTVDGVEAPPEHGVIQILASPWNSSRHVLIASGGNMDGVALAGRAFAHTPTYDSLDGGIKFVSGLEPVQERETNPAWQSPTTTFAQLGFGDRTITGIGTFQELYYFQRPPGWLLLPGSQLKLEIASSPALNLASSHIAVFLNEVPVGSIETGIGEDTFEATFDLPVALINETPLGVYPQEMVLRLAVSNYIQEGECEAVYQEASWLRANASSAFTILHDYMAIPDLQAFPYPFVSDNNPYPTTLVVPESPTNDELSMALSIAATLGHYAPADFEVDIVTADTANEDSLSRSNIIAIGTLTRNPLIDQMNESMGASSHPGVYEALNNPSSGIIREGISPWNDSRAVLLVYSQTNVGLQNTVTALSGSAPAVPESSTIAVVEGNLAVRALSVIEMPNQDNGAIGYPTPMAQETSPPAEQVAENESVENGGIAQPESAAVDFASTPTVEDESASRNGPELLQSQPVLVYILGLAVLAIPFAIWLSRRQMKP